MVIAKFSRTYSDPNEWSVLYCSVPKVTEVISSLEESGDLAGTFVSFINVEE